MDQSAKAMPSARHSASSLRRRHVEVIGGASACWIIQVADHVNVACSCFKITPHPIAPYRQYLVVF
jgi:hypothetical protein